MEESLSGKIGLAVNYKKLYSHKTVDIFVTVVITMVM